MSRADRLRTGNCTKADARSRLHQAEAYLLVARICLDDATDEATPSVASSLAVLAVIAAGDAVCCHRLGRRSRAQDHAQAAALIATVEPDGKLMSKRFSQVVTAKDDSHYGLSLVSRSRAPSMVDKAAMITAWAASLLKS